MLSLIDLALREVEAGQSGTRSRILGFDLNRSLELLAFFVIALLRAIERTEGHVRDDGGWIHRERFFKIGFALLETPKTRLIQAHIKEGNGLVRSGVKS